MRVDAYIKGIFLIYILGWNLKIYPNKSKVVQKWMCWYITNW